MKEKPDPFEQDRCDRISVDRSDDGVDAELKVRRYRRDGFEVSALVKEGRDPSVVLLHGAAGNALAWLPILPVLDGRRAILVDLPGHGESPPVEEWSLEALARNIGEAIGCEHPGSLVWGGHSWGGKVAAVLAGLRPDCVCGLLLIDPAPAKAVPIIPEEYVASSLAPEIGPWWSYAEAVAAAQKLQQYESWRIELRRAFDRGIERHEDGTVAGRVRREWLVSITAASLNHDDSALIRSIKCPTLLMVAEKSLWWQEPTNLAVLRDLTNVTTAVLAGRHYLHWDSPNRVIETARQWLQGLTT
jgi:pimeloyl-ACP methyl ester carboxylesterase